MAGAVWAISWGFIAQTDDGTLRVLGLTEGAWRALLNPALAIAVTGAAWWARRQPAMPAMGVFAGLAAMFAGNVLDVGLLGRATPASDLGWVAFLAGAAIVVAALGWAAARAMSAATSRPTLIGGAAVSVVAAVAVMSLAAPAAAALALLPLIDTLWQGVPSAGGTGSSPTQPAGAAPRSMVSARAVD